MKPEKKKRIVTLERGERIWKWSFVWEIVLYAVREKGKKKVAKWSGRINMKEIWEEDSGWDFNLVYLRGKIKKEKR